MKVGDRVYTKMIHRADNGDVVVSKQYGIVTQINRKTVDVSFTNGRKERLHFTAVIRDRGDDDTATSR